MPTAIVTGHLGLVGRAVTERLCGKGWTVHGFDNAERVVSLHPDDADYAPYDRDNLTHWHADVSDALAIRGIVNECDLIVHCAAQPSHDKSASDPVRDFEVNALGTLNMLELARRMNPTPVFVFMSTNKVYGSLEWRVDDDGRRYRLPKNAGTEDYWSVCLPYPGFTERTPIDHTTHSPFGCSKASADLYVQEYGRYYGMRTVCLRAGCLTGRHHAGVELHGFLAYLFKCAREGRPYTVYGFGGRQVRDQLHADDVAALVELLYCTPPACGEVYNIGGGYDNSCSVLEAIDAAERRLGVKMDVSFVATPRKGDHCVYYTDLTKVRGDYPEWRITMPLEAIYDELAAIPVRGAAPQAVGV